jgi:hypothetical protein
MQLESRIIKIEREQPMRINASAALFFKSSICNQINVNLNQLTSKRERSSYIINSGRHGNRIAEICISSSICDVTNFVRHGRGVA